jgi:hypothetical protein
LSAAHALVRNFWEVVVEMSEEDRVKYLKFVWARSRLPLNAQGFSRRHRISLLRKDHPDRYLPVAHTCFFSIDLPGYSSKAVLKAKLLYAITHCQAIDADDTTAARQVCALCVRGRARRGCVIAPCGCVTALRLRLRRHAGGPRGSVGSRLRL